MFPKKQKLYQIISYVNDNIDIKIGAYILLGETDEAEKLLNGLPEEHQQFFREYPIYALIDTEK